MEFVIDFLTNLIYVGCFISIGQLFFFLEQRNCKGKIAICIGLTFLTTVVFNYADLLWKAIAHVLCVWITLSLFFVEKKKILLGLYIGVAAFLTMFPMMLQLPILEVVRYMQIPIMQKVVKLLVYVVIFLIVIGMGIYFRKKHLNGIRGIGTRYLLLLELMLLADSMIVGLLGDFIINDIQAERKLGLILLYIGVVLGILVQIILLINALITRNVYKENEALVKQYLDSQQEHYAYLEKREYETKRFRHDIKNHLLVLENCMETQDYAKAYKYLDTLNEKVNAFSNHVSVNNNIADAILNKFYSDAQEEGIELQVKGHFPLECHIAPFDICTILSNLLSNAILAESQCGGKQVSVDIRYTKDEVLIFVENDYGHELQGKNGALETTKADSFNHGFGLSNVTECVEKAGGYISISTKDNRFKVMLSMRNE